MTVDVFLLDWERPDAPAKPGVEQPISVWRTYLVQLIYFSSYIFSLPYLLLVAGGK